MKKARRGITFHGPMASLLFRSTDRLSAAHAIREAIRAGDFDTASQMLGRAYSIAG